MKNFFTFKFFITPAILYISYYVGAILIPIIAWNTPSIQEDITSLILVVILTEIAWRIFMEFFVAYFDMHRALKNKD